MAFKPIFMAGLHKLRQPGCEKMKRKWREQLHDPRFLCQPLFSEVIAKHICRVLSPNRPFQELNMYKDERYNVHRITFTFIKTSDLGPIRHTDEETSSSSWKFNFGKPLVASTLTCPHPYQFCYGHQSLHPGVKIFWENLLGKTL